MIVSSKVIRTLSNKMTVVLNHSLPRLPNPLHHRHQNPFLLSSTSKSLRALKATSGSGNGFISCSALSARMVSAPVVKTLVSLDFKTSIFKKEKIDLLELPEDIHSSTTLEVLFHYSHFVSIISPSGLRFPSLKNLRVEMYNPPRNMTERLFSACLLLEEFSVVGLMSDVGVVISFNFWSPSLKKLGLYKVGEFRFSYEEIFPTFPNLTHVRSGD